MNNPASRQRGGIMILSGIVLTVLLAFGALAIDIGNLLMVRNELQNAADASAMAGAPCLNARTDCGNATATTPDWATASTRANNFIGQNKVQGTALSNATVTYGYWNMNGTPAGLQPSTITPSTYDYPAVQVTLSKEAGKNGGAVLMSLAHIFGLEDAAVTATATAVVSHPNALRPFPLVLDKCLYDTYWDYNTGSPKLATQVNPPGFDLPQVIGQPYFFKATSTYKVGACEAGQWSSLLTDSNSSNFIRDMITNGSPDIIAIGDLLWIQPGSKNALYPVVNACSGAGNKTCEYVRVPVVETIDTHSRQPVLAFACVRILSAAGGSGKYILFQMSADPTNCQVSGSGVGPNYGVSTPARLVQ